MANEIAFPYENAGAVDIIAFVYQPDGTERDFGVGDAGISLVDTDHANLYIGSCATIQAGDLIVIKNTAGYVASDEYRPHISGPTKLY